MSSTYRPDATKWIGGFLETHVIPITVSRRAYNHTDQGAALDAMADAIEAWVAPDTRPIPPVIITHTLSAWKLRWGIQ